MLQTTQSIVLGILFLIVAVVSLITVIVKGAFTASYVISLIVGVFLAILALYDTDCLVTGQCTVWSWLRTGFYSIVPLIIIIMTTFGTFTFRLYDFEITKRKPVDAE